MAQAHVPMFGLSVVPAGKAWAHEKFTGENTSRDALIQLLLSDRRVRREVDYGLLR